jgi:hypothetical protein
MTKVDFLSYDLHRPDGLAAYQGWLSSHVTGGSIILNIWYSPELRQEIIVWDDGT